MVRNRPETCFIAAEAVQFINHGNWNPDFIDVMALHVYDNRSLNRHKASADSPRAGPDNVREPLGLLWMKSQHHPHSGDAAMLCTAYTLGTARNAGGRNSAVGP